LKSHEIISAGARPMVPGTMVVDQT
jgi:hypothetical protein